MLLKANDWKCSGCGKVLPMSTQPHTYDGEWYCDGCNVNITTPEMPTIPLIKEFNEPPHYHKYEIDTIDFLQKGFPPSVFKGFAIGSAIKYLHRYENKNGMEDLEKALDYIKRLIEFHKEY
jgi:hypothetical protein